MRRWWWTAGIVAATLTARPGLSRAGTVGSASPATPRQADVAPRLAAYLMTMGPGGPIYERFGHNAIWIHDSTTGNDLVYNFGIFDFNEPGFVWHFVQGRPRYRLAAMDLQTTFAIYRHAQRTLEVQELALPTTAKAQLAYDLAQNALPENMWYQYDYYLDNCSTRVRDVLDRVLGGALRRATEGVPADGDFRFHTQRSTASNAFYYLGIETLMGRRTDTALDQWGEMFLPAKVQQRVRELRVAGDDGRKVPLVSREATLLSFDTYAVLPAPPDWTARLLFVGGLLALVIASGLFEGGTGAAGRILAGGWGVLGAVAGLVLGYVAFFTNHVMASPNLNLLLLSPFSLALPWLLRSRRRRPLASRLAMLFLVLLWIGTAFAMVGLLQHNREIAALLALPGTAAGLVALAVSRRRVAAPPPPR